MMIEVYGTKNCSRCTMVKNILSSKGYEVCYKLLEDLDVDVKNEVMTKASERGLKSLPIIFLNNEPVDMKEVIQ